MPKPRQRTQLTVQIPDPALLTRLRALADRRRQTLTTVVVEALEAMLAGPAAGPAADDTLLQRVEALERRLQALERRPAAVPVVTVPGTAAAPLPAPAAPVLELDLPEGAITTAELADRLGMRRHALNERLRRMGGACVGLELTGWRCIGQHPSPNGGPPRWCWEPVTAGHA